MMSGLLAAMEYENVLNWWSLDEPKVALHIAALPSAFLMPASSLLSSASGTTSDDQACADRYISQKAVLPEMGACGIDDLTAPVSAFLPVSEEGVVPQEVRARIVISRAAFEVVAGI